MLCANLHAQTLDTAFASEGFTEAFESIDVAASEMGIVKKVHVKLGQQVRAGELLVELDASVLEASLAMAKAKATSSARIKAAEVEYATMEKRFDKLTELLDRGAGRPEEVEKARANADVAKHNIAALKEELEVLSFQVKELEAKIEERKIRSPLDGIIISVHKKQGEHVSTSEPLIAKVVDLTQLRVTFYLPTNMALDKNVDDHVTLFIQETSQQAKARIEYVAPVTSADSGRVRLDVVIGNQNGQYRSGLRCRLTNHVVGQMSFGNPLR